MSADIWTRRWFVGCECGITPEHTWTTYGDSVEPGSQLEWNPDCPKHGEAIERRAASEKAARELRTRWPWIHHTGNPRRWTIIRSRVNDTWTAHAPVLPPPHPRPRRFPTFAEAIAYADHKAREAADA